MEPSFLYTWAVVFLAALVHGAAGFGAALVAMPLLVLVMDVRDATPLVAILTLTVNALLLGALRRDFEIRRLLPLCLGALAGIPAGILFLRYGPRSFLELLLGLVLISYALHGLVSRRRPPPTGRKGAFLFGLASGFVGGAINTGGPPAVIYMSSQPWRKEEVHASLQFYFLLVGFLVVAGHALSGLTTAATMNTYVTLLPALSAGSAAGYLAHRRVSADSYRTMILVLLLVLGILMIGSL
jgi:uncharacterized membrane protein YfcA